MSDPKIHDRPVCSENGIGHEWVWDHIVASDDPGDKKAVVDSLQASAARLGHRYPREEAETLYDATLCTMQRLGQLVNFDDPSRPLRLNAFNSNILYHAQDAFLRVGRHREEPGLNDPPQATLTIGGRIVPADEVRIGRDPNWNFSAVPHRWFPLKGVRHEGHQVYVKVHTETEAVRLFAEAGYRVDSIDIVKRGGRGPLG